LAAFVNRRLSAFYYRRGNLLTFNFFRRAI
jgi:hypothetical protein